MKKTVNLHFVLVLSFLLLSNFCKSQVTLNQVILKIDSNNWDTAFVNYTSSIGKVDFIGSTVFFDHTTNCMNVNSGFAFNSKILGSSMNYDTTMVLAYPGYETQYFKLDAYWDTSTSSSPPNRIILDAFTYDSCTITKIEKLDDLKDLNLSIYPNPSKDAITINSKQHISHFELTTIEGKKAIINPLGQNSFDISQNSSGVYLLRLVINEKSISKKVIVYD